MNSLFCWDQTLHQKVWDHVYEDESFSGERVSEVVGERCITFVQKRNDETVFLAYNLRTGSELWQRKIQRNVTAAGFCVLGEAIVVSCADGEGAYYLTAINITHGELQWERPGCPAEHLVCLNDSFAMLGVDGIYLMKSGLELVSEQAVYSCAKLDDGLLVIWSKEPSSFELGVKSLDLQDSLRIVQLPGSHATGWRLIPCDAAQYFGRNIRSNLYFLLDMVDGNPTLHWLEPGKGNTLHLLVRTHHGLYGMIESNADLKFKVVEFDLQRFEVSGIVDSIKRPSNISNGGEWLVVSRLGGIGFWK